MGRKLKLIALFFTATPALLLTVILFSLSYTHEKGSLQTMNLNLSQKSVRFQALPEDKQIATVTDFEPLDVRVTYLDAFLSNYNSPLLKYSELLVEAADKYDLDYRLLPAIAMKESTLCKNIAKNSDFNCWGFGIYGKKRTSFTGYDQAIEIVAKTLSENYIKIGLVEPHEIVTKYNPGSTTWADEITRFMEKIHPSTQIIAQNNTPE